MKAIAEFAMRGRFQALLVCLVSAGSILFCWIGAAVLALVTLRKGVGEGALLLLWALLPAGWLLYAYGDGWPLALLSGAGFLALVLRTTVNLPLAILASLAVGAVVGSVMLSLGADYLTEMVTFFTEVLANVEQQLSEQGESMQFVQVTQIQLAGIIGSGLATMTVMCLLLARYWQAALYNPGGFGKEFRALRYSPGVATALAIAGTAISALGVDYRTWVVITFLPLAFAGLALVHAWVRTRGPGKGTGWLVGFYLAFILLDPVKILVVFAAIADSWFNFRQRWGKTPGNDVGRREDD